MDASDTGTFSINAEDRLVILRYSGKVTEDLSAKAFSAYWDFAQTVGGHGLLIDYSEASEIAISFPQMVSMTFRRLPVYRKLDHRRVAIWAPTDPVYGSARMYASLTVKIETMEVEAFRDVQEALNFLDQGPRRSGASVTTTS